VLVWDHPVGIPKDPDYPIDPYWQIKYTTWFWTMLTGLSVTGGSWPYTSMKFADQSSSILFFICIVQNFFGVFAVFPIIGGAWSITFQTLYNKKTDEVFIEDPNYRKLLMYILDSSTITREMQFKAFVIYKELGIERLRATPYEQLLPVTVYDDPEPNHQPVPKDGVHVKKGRFDPVLLYDGFYVTLFITMMDLWVFI
jgi:hypothetical protein